MAHAVMTAVASERRRIHIVEHRRRAEVLREQCYDALPGHGAMKSNATNRRMREKSRSFSVIRTQPASRHETASRTSFANAFETRPSSRPSCFAIAANTSPDRCQASADGEMI